MFVPTADQIERPGKSLESGTSFESRLVQKIKKQCNDLATFQGVFVATPNGLLLAGSHEAVHDPQKVEQHMRQGLEKWAKLPAAERLLSKAEFTKAVGELAVVEAKSQYPQDGLVLSAICRDLPRGNKPDASLSRNAYNQDYAWFRKAETRAFLPAQPIKGAKHQVAREVVERLARFHFVDLVRGHTSSYPQEAVERAELSAEVTDVNGNLISLRFQGRTRTSEVHDGVHIEGKWNAPGPGIPKLQKRGVDAGLEGQAVYDLKAEKFVTFDLIALTSRWGGNAYNGRLNDRDFGPSPMGIVLELAGNSAAEQVPPLYFRYYGWK
ncbi:MAG: hypothetical protein O3A00_17090 [Planctomycetota bacterium]|nr:hypothetical protein [Planctomycetota bacterium]